jgi:fumarylacetoacetate (FAA) hydrolase
MKLVTFTTAENQLPRPGALLGQQVIDLQAAAALVGVQLPASLLEIIQAGSGVWETIRQVLAEPGQGENPARLAGAGERAIWFERDQVRLSSPIRPISLRDAYAFEQHVKTANQNRGRDVPEDWYRFPVFYYTNPNSVIGTDEPLKFPRYTKALDFELEIAAVVGLEGRDLGAEAAAGHIFGFTIFNDWSARDIQRAEMKVGLGPAKGKDFASSLGPCIITVDELADRATGRPGVFDLAMTARINGKTISQGNFKDIFWSFGEILARVSEETTIYPGDVIGSGTVGTGCLLELTKSEGPWLQPGDVVELEIERIGVLRNEIR